MKIGGAFDSIMSSCGFYVICGEFDSPIFSKVAKNIVFIPQVSRFSK